VLGPGGVVFEEQADGGVVLVPEGVSVGADWAPEPFGGVAFGPPQPQRGGAAAVAGVGVQVDEELVGAQSVGQVAAVGQSGVPAAQRRRGGGGFVAGGGGDVGAERADDAVPRGDAAAG